LITQKVVHAVRIFSQMSRIDGGIHIHAVAEAPAFPEKRNVFSPFGATILPRLVLVGN